MELKVFLAVLVVAVVLLMALVSVGVRKLESQRHQIGYWHGQCRKIERQAAKRWFDMERLLGDASVVLYQGGRECGRASFGKILGTLKGRAELKDSVIFELPKVAYTVRLEYVRARENG